MLLTMLWWAQLSVVFPRPGFLIPEFREILQYPTKFLLLIKQARGGFYFLQLKET